MVRRTASALRLREIGAAPAPPEGAVRMFLVTRLRLLTDTLAHALPPAGVKLVGAADALEDVLSQLAELEPHVVVIDAAIPGALPATRAIVSAAPDVRAVVLGIADAPGEVLAFAEAGAAAYVPRDGRLSDLVRAVEGAVVGELDVSPRVAAALIARVGELAWARPSGSVRLTARELEVLRLIDGGLSNKQIARQLQIELATVKNHVHNILAKLEVSSRTEAARFLRDSAAAADLVPV
jgi:two-component system, NarL family, nitrate/nitrite response regulator NarL